VYSFIIKLTSLITSATGEMIWSVALLQLASVLFSIYTMSLLWLKIPSIVVFNIAIGIDTLYYTMNIK